MPDYNDQNYAWLMPEVYDGKPIPEITRIGLAKYVLYGAPVGSFLEGLLTNDLRRAVGAADPENVLLLKEYVMWLNNNPSGDCWGTDARVRLWQQTGGMVGREWVEDPKYAPDPKRPPKYPSLYWSAERNVHRIQVPKVPRS